MERWIIEKMLKWPLICPAAKYSFTSTCVFKLQSTPWRKFSVQKCDACYSILSLPEKRLRMYGMFIIDIYHKSGSNNTSLVVHQPWFPSIFVESLCLDHLLQLRHVMSLLQFAKIDTKQSFWSISCPRNIWALYTKLNVSYMLPTWWWSQGTPPITISIACNHQAGR